MTRAETQTSFGGQNTMASLIAHRPSIVGWRLTSPPIVSIVFQERSLSRKKEKDSRGIPRYISWYTGCEKEETTMIRERERGRYYSRARRSRAAGQREAKRRRDNAAPRSPGDQAAGRTGEITDAREGRKRTQNGPSTDEVGIWIKSKRGQRLGDRAISDLEEWRPLF